MAIKTQNGFQTWQVACSGYNALRHALDGVDRMGRKMPEFADLPQDEQDAYDVTAQLVEEQAEGWSGHPAADWAIRAYEFWRVNASSSFEWKALPPKDRAAWEAFVRHVVNVLQMEPGDELSEHEERWAGWAEKQAHKYRE